MMGEILLIKKGKQTICGIYKIIEALFYLLGFSFMTSIFRLLTLFKAMFSVTTYSIMFFLPASSMSLFDSSS